METNEEIDILLWEYIDGTCSSSDTQRVSNLIECDPVWKQKYAELTAIHTGISNSLELQEPSMRFTQNVMDAIAAEHIAPATKKYINKSIIRGIAAIFIVMLTGILGYALSIASRGTSASNVLPKLDVSKLNLARFYNSTTMMLMMAVSIVIGLVFLDTMLRRKRAEQSTI